MGIIGVALVEVKPFGPVHAYVKAPPAGLLVTLAVNCKFKAVHAPEVENEADTEGGDFSKTVTTFEGIQLVVLTGAAKRT